MGIFSLLIFSILLQVKQLKAGSREDATYEVSHLRRCFNPDGHLGSCISINDCPSLKKILENKSVERYDFLRSSICKNERGKAPIVCCMNEIKFQKISEEGKHFNRIIFPDDFERIKKSLTNPSKVSTSGDVESSKEMSTTTATVTTTTGESSDETSRIIWDIIKPTMRPTTKIPKSKDFIFETTSESVVIWEKIKIAATTTTTKEFKTESTTKYLPDLPKNSKFPRPPQCGRVTIENKIYGGEDANLEEFSWMVILEYRNETTGELVLDCAGSIINSRYILTAAHCVVGEILRINGKLVSVRIGDHNTATEIDCSKNDCRKKYQRMEIESIIPHEDFAFKSYSGTRNRHDIALLRLKRNIDFGKTGLNPACLPSNDVAEEFTNSTNFMVAGWGHNGLQRRTSVKQKLKLPFVDHKTCRELFSKRFLLAEEQICAGGRFREDSCNGDSGGPLMHLSGSSWIVEGLVSFGIGCGLEQPGVYTNLRHYLDWIDKNVEV